MAFTVTIDVDREFQVDCAFDKCFDLVADVPESAGHFPKVDTLYDLGDNTYLWEMEKIGLESYYFQTAYACQYKCDKAKGTVIWTPAETDEKSSARVKGKWQVKKVSPKKTKMHLTTTAEIEMPFPKLVKLVVAPLVSREFEGLIGQYIESLKETFES